MKNEEKLKLIIHKAVDNGFNPSSHYLGDEYFNMWLNDGEGRHNQEYTIIFSKPFLKSYFGEEIVDETGETYDEYVEYYKKHNLIERIGVKEEFENAYGNEIRWEYFAKELVLADDKIDYLYKKL